MSQVTHITDKDYPPVKHSNAKPSQLDRWRNCPSSVVLQDYAALEARVAALIVSEEIGEMPENLPRRLSQPQPQEIPRRVMYLPRMEWTQGLSMTATHALLRAGFRSREELVNLADNWQICGLSPDEYREVCEWLLC